MRRTLLVVLLATAACTTAPIQTTNTLPPPVTTTTTTMPVGPGQCGQPLLTDERIPSTDLADEIVTRFIADRRAGEGAEGCLTGEAAQAYGSPTFPTCLYSCTDLAVLELPDPPVISDEGATALGPSREIQVEYQIGESLHETMREVYEVQTIRGPGDQRQVLIGSVTVEPESFVDDVAGKQVIGDFLAALANGAWDVANALLVNQGVASAVAQRLPNISTASPEEVLAPFCENAMCGAGYEILDSKIDSASSRTYQVEFDGSDGPVTVSMPVTMLQGQLRVGDLPPDGSAGTDSTSLGDLLFPDGRNASLALVRYSSVQVGDQWFLWRGARYQRNIAVIGDEVAFDGVGGVELAPLTDGTVGAPTILFTTGSKLVGTAMDDGEPSILVSDGQGLFAYRLSDKELRTIVEMSGDASITCASVGGTEVLVTMLAGDSTTYGLYSLADGSPINQFEPDKADGCAVLAPDAATFVYPADVSLHNPQSVVLISTADASEIDRWSVLAQARIGSATQPPLAFDGRYVVADLMVPLDDEPYVQNLDIGRRFIVDTQTGDQWMVDTSAQVLFPPG